MNEYYSNLLILQYHNKPKAKATVEASVGLIPDNLIQEVANGFNINTAVGKQLDILGQYIGLDRGYIDEGESKNLNDDDYRLLLKLKIICNTDNASYKSICDSLYDFFGTDIRMDSTGNMDMVYFIPPNAVDVIKAALQKGVLPKPMGVNLDYVIEYKKKFFGFCTYNNTMAVYKTGFRDYNNPNKDGECFTYDKRIDL